MLSWEDGLHPSESLLFDFLSFLLDSVEAKPLHQPIIMLKAKYLWPDQFWRCGEKDHGPLIPCKNLVGCKKCREKKHNAVVCLTNFRMCPKCGRRGHGPLKCRWDCWLTRQVTSGRGEDQQKRNELIACTTRKGRFRGQRGNKPRRETKVDQQKVGHKVREAKIWETMTWWGTYNRWIREAKTWENMTWWGTHNRRAWEVKIWENTWPYEGYTKGK